MEMRSRKYSRGRRSSGLSVTASRRSEIKSGSYSVPSNSDSAIIARISCGDLFVKISNIIIPIA